MTSRTKVVLFGFLLGILVLSLIAVFTHRPQRIGNSQGFDPRPSAIPDRIILTWCQDPATSQAVTWRTDSTVTTPKAELAVATASPKFTESAMQIAAETDVLSTTNGTACFHSVKFKDLQPNTVYAYRVGDGSVWSEWLQFTTAADKFSPFSFIYLGDAQNNILSMWSRTIRTAYSETSEARFLIHAGDLVNRANSDIEWAEWFRAGGWIYAMLPSIPAAGNHEYPKDANGNRKLTAYWRAQFTLPQNGIPELPESSYYLDYQGTRLISLNSNERLAEQTVWLEHILDDNPCRWTIITFHHPVFSSAKNRDNPELRTLWKPLFDQYRVDLVLQGHDHSYARGRNLPVGVNTQDTKAGTMYVVSVSGPKMYALTSTKWMDRSGENMQLHQVIHIAGDSLTYRAVTATGVPYDAFTLVKQPGDANLLSEDLPL